MKKKQKKLLTIKKLSVLPKSKSSLKNRLSDAREIINNKERIFSKAIFQRKRDKKCKKIIHFQIF